MQATDIMIHVSDDLDTEKKMMLSHSLESLMVLLPPVLIKIIYF